jgi:hypothetical protein
MTHTYEETVERLVKAKEHGVSMRRVALRAEVAQWRIQRIAGIAAGRTGYGEFVSKLSDDECTRVNLALDEIRAAF